MRECTYLYVCVLYPSLEILADPCVESPYLVPIMEEVVVGCLYLCHAAVAVVPHLVPKMVVSFYLGFYDEHVPRIYVTISNTPILGVTGRDSVQLVSKKIKALLSACTPQQ